MDETWSIRPALRADVAALLPIERRSFGDPWSSAAFTELLESAHGFGLVATHGALVGGYLIARAAASEAEILNLAVAPEFRRLRLGRRLLDFAIDQLARRGTREIFLEVREGNFAARELYRARGFRTVGARARYYRNPVEDALVLRLEVPAGA
jgi:ribosomal-protein-alanine N-acetyltransferase